MGFSSQVRHARNKMESRLKNTVRQLECNLVVVGRYHLKYLRLSRDGNLSMISVSYFSFNPYQGKKTPPSGKPLESYE